MANLKLLLGLIPSTSKIEKVESDLIREYEKLQAFIDSEEFTKYSELDALVNSGDFQKKRKEIESLKYKSSEEFNKESEYKKLVKAKDISLYFKTRDGSDLKKFKETEGSEKLVRYEKLEDIINSAEFKQKQQDKEVRFKDTEEYKLLVEYKELKGNTDIKFYYKFKKSKQLANFNQVDGSQKLSRYEELKEYVASEKFTSRKEYLLDDKRFEKNKMFGQQQEFGKLKKSDDIVWYFKVKDSDKFDILKNRELTFSDEFDAESLDTKKWLTNNYWGDKLLNDRFSLETDLHCFTEKDNIEVRSSLLKISTKPQKTEGKVWNPDLGGFRNKNFDFTSAIVTTGKSFRQQYGVFSTKVKLNTASGTTHGFRMLADKITPHIDICRTEKSKVWMDLFNNGSKGVKTSLGSKYSKDFYIYTLEWTVDKIVWKINGIEVFKQTNNIPKEPMYLILSGGLEKPISGSSTMEVDWVRVYKSK